MKIRPDKVLSIVIILLLSGGAFAFLPSAAAHSPPWNIPTYAYVATSPSTVQVGQYALIVMWLDKFPPTSGGAGGDLWRGFTLDITKPDGTKETIPYTRPTSQVGSAWMTYTPDQVGKYSIVFSWPGQTLTNGTGVPNLAGLAYVGDNFEGSTSNPTILTVQQNAVPSWQEPTLPDYWTRPIPTANREWSQLASSWLKGSEFRYSGFQEWGQAPNSAHILYAKEIISGGIANEYFGAVKYDTTDYENFFGAPIVMSGKIYYNAGTYPNYGYTAVDLRTGETLWHKNGTDNGLNNPYIYGHLGGGGADGPNLAKDFVSLSFGQLYHYYGVNGEGIKDHLWMTQSLPGETITPAMINSLTQPQIDRLTEANWNTLREGRAVTLPGDTRWYLLDGNTGDWVLTLKNVPSGTSVTDQHGSILLYRYVASTGNFLAWNVTQSIGPPSPTGTGQEQWEPRIGAVIDAVNDDSWTKYGPKPVGSGTPWFADDIRPRSGYTMNVTGPKNLPTTMNVIQDEKRVPQMMFLSDMRNLPRFGSSDMFFQAAAIKIDYHVAPYSPMPDKTFTQNNNLGYGVTELWSKNITKPLGGNLTFNLGPISYEDKVFTLYSKETMQWWGYSLDDGSQIWGPTEPQPSWDMYGSNDRYAYGNLYSGGYGGVLHCYDMKTGTLKWKYTAEGIGYESPYGNYPLSYVGIADGKVYLYSTEHSPTQPLWRGSYLRAIDAINGHEIWKSLNFVSGAAIADGCIVAGNSYDNRMYVYGKGPSATTLSASPKVVGNGASIIIEGTVTDQSPGAKDTPAISDSYMSAWMDYLYMKQNIPGDAFGVPVRLTAIGPNGNTEDIGTVTSDMSGMFKKGWTPASAGEYTIVATFEGTNSYGSSYAETALLVTQAATNTPTPTPTAEKTADQIPMYLAVATIIIIIAIAVATIILKRK